MNPGKDKRPSNAVSRKARKRVTLPGTRYNWPWIVALCIVTATVFFPMLSNGFTNWDDQFYILQNPMLKGPDWTGILTRPLMANYHPVTVATLAINYMVSGSDPFSYHLVNYLLHILNACLLFFLAFKLSKGNQWVAFITAFLFAVHPMHIESVAWASERKDVLFTMFFLLSLIWYLQYLRKPEWKNYLGTLAMFSLSLLSKPAAVTLPVVLLLVDWYRARSFKDNRVWLEKIPFFVLSLVIGLLTLKYQHAVKAIAEEDMYSFMQKIGFSFYGYGEYIRRLIWPFPLSAIHPLPDPGEFPTTYKPSVFLAVLFLIGVSFLRKDKSLLFGIAFFSINIVLVLQFITFGHAVIAERYTYLPYAGLIFGLVMVWAESDLPAAVMKGLLLLMILFGVALGISSFRQVQVWNNSGTLWSQAIEAYPKSYIAHSNRGQYLASRLGKYSEALDDYAIALEEMPNDSFSLINRATIYINQQNFPLAMNDADSLVIHHPDIAKGYLFRGLALSGLGQSEKAFTAFAECIKRDPTIYEAWANRGIISYNTKQDYSAALDDFNQAIDLNPEAGLTYKNRARCFIKFGRRDEAIRDLEKAKELGIKVDDDLMEMAKSIE